MPQAVDVPNSSEPLWPRSAAVSVIRFMPSRSSLNEQVSYCSLQSNTGVCVCVCVRVKKQPS